MRCLHLIGEVMKQFSPLKAVPRVVNSKNCTYVSGLAMVHVRIHDRCLYYSLVDRYICKAERPEPGPSRLTTRC
jgi:hypothetical protein